MGGVLKQSQNKTQRNTNTNTSGSSTNSVTFTINKGWGQYWTVQCSSLIVLVLVILILTSRDLSIGGAIVLVVS